MTVTLAGGAVMLLLGSGLFARQAAQGRPAAAAPVKPHTTWKDYGGGPDSSQYSALTQINKSNVATLQVAWKYPIDSTALFNPIVVDGTMYVKAKGGVVGDRCRQRARNCGSIRRAASRTAA